MAGGTDVMVEINFGRLQPASLLDLSQVGELAGWERTNGSVFLGAGTTFAQIVREHTLFDALADAALTVGSPADPQPRDDRRQPRHGVAGRRRHPAAGRLRRRDRHRGNRRGQAPSGPV